jgi:hypothetical protein
MVTCRNCNGLIKTLLLYKLKLLLLKRPGKLLEPVGKVEEKVTRLMIFTAHI